MRTLHAGYVTDNWFAFHYLTLESSPQKMGGGALASNLELGFALGTGPTQTQSRDISGEARQAFCQEQCSFSSS